MPILTSFDAFPAKANFIRLACIKLHGQSYSAKWNRIGRLYEESSVTVSSDWNKVEGEVEFKLKWMTRSVFWPKNWKN